MNDDAEVIYNPRTIIPSLSEIEGDEQDPWQEEEWIFTLYCELDFNEE